MFNRIPGWLLVGVMVSATMFIGLTAVYRYEVFSPIDEAGHFEYVRFVAEEHRLPRLNQIASEEMLALREGVYPAPPLVPAENAGLAGTVYEAFQPPIYYLAATPVFWLATSYRTKVTLLRLFGLGLYLLAMFLFLIICRDLIFRDWKIAFAFGSLCFLLPGNIIRAITIGNEQLELPLGVLGVLLLLRTLERKSWKYFTAAALVVGLGVLTKLSFIAFLPAFGIVAFQLWRSAGYSRILLKCILPSILLPVLMGIPWALWNSSYYGSWTANEQAAKSQIPINNPERLNYGMDVPFNLAASALDASTPQDWMEVGNQPFPSTVRWLLFGIIFFVPGLFIIGQPRMLLGVPGISILITPLLTSYAAMAYTTVITNWQIMAFRYLRLALPGWFLLAYLTWSGSTRHPNIVSRVIIVSIVALAGLWWAFARNYLSI